MSRVNEHAASGKSSRPGAGWLTSLLIVCCLSLVSSGADEAWGQAPTPFPKFSGARVYIASDVPGREAYSGLDDMITDVEQRSGQTYYVVVVNSTGSGTTATRDYAEALNQQWLAEAKQMGIGFDTKQSVLIVVSLQNRQVAVNPGLELASRFGLEDARIDRELVRPSFVPEARVGNYPGAIMSLVQATDDWIAKRDSNSKQLREQAEQRAAEVRQNAADTLDEANRQLELARKEVLEKKNSGLVVTEFEETLTDTARQLSDLKAKGDPPRVVLREAQAARQRLQGVIEELRVRSLQQVEAAILIDGLPSKVVGLEEKMQTSRNKGLPTSAISETLDSISQSIDAARGLLASDPGQALEQAKSLSQQVDSTDQLLGELPELKDQRDEVLKVVKPMQQALEGALSEAEKSGVDVASIRARFEETMRQNDAAAKTDPGDMKRAIATLEGSKPALVEMREQVETASSRHRLFTLILPLSLLGVVAVGTLLVLGLVRTLHVQARKSASAKLKAAREQATTMMERLDGLKERHKLLPVTDTDFEQPMAGETLEVYESVDGRLRKLWDRWLKTMEVVDEAERLVRAQSSLGVSRLKKAEELLGRELTDTENAEIEASIKADLDQLNQAHESAEAALKDFRAEVDELKARLGTLSAAGVPTAPYEPEQGASTTLVEKAQAILVPDPLGANGLVGRAQERLNSLSQRVGEIHQRFEAAQEMRKAVDALSARVSKLRGEGLKLEEQQGNPDRQILAAGQSLGEAMDALHAGDPSNAARRADAASASLQEATQTVELVLRAREECQPRIKERQAANERLAGELANARAIQHELDRDYAQSSWQAVAGYPEAASSRLTQCEQEIERAASLASEREQRYLEATRRLETVAHSQDEVAGLLKSQAEVLAGLKEIRQECHQQAGELADKASKVIALFEENGGLGASPRNALAAAQEAHRKVETTSAENPPDWLSVRQWIARADESYKIAREQAEVELKYRREVLNRLNELSQRADRLGGTLRSEDKDRPPANLRYRSAIEALARVASAIQSPAADWRALSEQLNDVASDLAKSEALAHEDFQLANQAIAEIASANRVIRQARTFSSMGYSPDLQDPERQLKQAEASLQRQDYEQAIQIASAAENKARAAYHAAQQDARERQMRIDAERRRRTRMESARRGDPLGGMGPMIAGAAISILLEAAEASASSGSRGGGFKGSFGGGNKGGGSGGSRAASTDRSSRTSQTGW